MAFLATLRRCAIKLSTGASPSVGGTAAIPNIITDGAGRSYNLDDLVRTQPSHKKKKLKPHIINKRLRECRTYTGKERAIRYSPYRLQRICKFVSGLPLPEALLQLEFLNMGKAPLVRKVLARTANLAEIRDGLQYSQLEVAECFATHGSHLKRIKIMGKGRHGIMHHRFSHMRVVIREIDFPLRIYMAQESKGKLKRWIALQKKGQADFEKRRAETEEVAQLERQLALKAGETKE